VFVVHPSNPVTKLTLEQLGDIHTGKITNWKQVGGRDQAITVYSDAVTGGTRAMIKKLVMGGAEYASSVKSLTSVSRVPHVVAKDESSIGGVGKGFTEGVAVKLVQSSKIERPLGFVTLGEPSAKVRQVIEAFKTTVVRK
jgi:phosphate transport system substrate-binding protein